MNIRPINVLQLIDNMLVGGAQRLLITMAQHRHLADFNMSVVSLGQPGEMGGELEQSGISTISLPSRRFWNPRRIIRVSHIIRDQKIDVVHTHLTSANIVGAIAGSLARVPVIGTLHNERADPGFYLPGRYPLETLLLKRRAKRIIAVGSKVAESQTKRFGAGKLVTIANATGKTRRLDAAERKEFKRELTGSTDRPLLIAVGQISAQKAYPDLLTAMKIICRAHPDALLLIAGGGAGLKDLQALIRAQGLDGNVMLLGERRDIPRLLNIADIFVMSSHWEGLPVAILEAMMAGLPVVSTAVGELPEILGDGTGIIVPPKSPDQLGATLSELLSDPERLSELGRRALDKAESDYSVDAWIKTLGTLYAEVASSSKPR